MFTAFDKSRCRFRLNVHHSVWINDFPVCYRVHASCATCKGFNYCETFNYIYLYYILVLEFNSYFQHMVALFMHGFSEAWREKIWFNRWTRTFAFYGEYYFYETSIQCSNLTSNKSDTEAKKHLHTTILFCVLIFEH